MFYRIAKWVTFVCVLISFLLNGLTSIGFFLYQGLPLGLSFLIGVLLLAVCGVMLLTKRFGWALIASLLAAALLCYLGFYLQMRKDVLFSVILQSQYSSAIIPFLCALTFGFFMNYENKQEQIVFLKTLKDQEPKSTIFKDEG